jgi:hypothetical protein
MKHLITHPVSIELHSETCNMIWYNSVHTPGDATTAWHHNHILSSSDSSPWLVVVGSRSLPVEGLLEGVQVLWLEREEHVDGVVLVASLRDVRRAAAEHLRGGHEPGAAPAEVGVVDGHAEPADDPQVGLGHELAARRLVALVRLKLQVVDDGAHAGVVDAGHRALDPLRHEAQRLRQHVAHPHGDQVPHDGVAEVGRRERRAQALPDVGRDAQPRVAGRREAPGDAHGAPQVRRDRAVRGRARRAARPDACQQLGRHGVDARHEGPRRPVEVGRGVDRVLAGGDVRRGARAQERPVVRRRPRGGLPARQRRPRPDELDRAGAVHRHVVHARAHGHAAALEEGHLQRSVFFPLVT